MDAKRAGQYIKQLSGDFAYNAFIPKPLPPESPIVFDPELINILSKADQAVGRLDGVLKSIPNHELFVMMYIKKEAVLSSQIEGTQASLSDILEKEEDVLSKKVDNDVKATLNYIDAMNYGLERRNKLPLSLRLIKEMHKVLLTGVRGADKYPGEFRRSQNWIGPAGSTLSNAMFIPPPVFEMNESMGQLEKYIYADKIYPVLIDCGLVHAQFETIHPFVDGNGRIGRLLVTFLLCTNNVTSQPILYLSYYFKKNKQEYYNRLMAIRTDGDWEGWLKFFLNGIVETSANVVELSNKIIELHDRTVGMVHKSMPRHSNKAIELLGKLFVHPVLSVNRAKNMCDISYNAAKGIIQKFVALGILTEKSDKKRDRRYFFSEYIKLLNEGTELP
jgi:Fic family protein